MLGREPRTPGWSSALVRGRSRHVHSDRRPRGGLDGAWWAPIPLPGPFRSPGRGVVGSHSPLSLSPPRPPTSPPLPLTSGAARGVASVLSMHPQLVDIPPILLCFRPVALPPFPPRPSLTPYYFPTLPHPPSPSPTHLPFQSPPPPSRTSLDCASIAVPRKLPPTTCRRRRWRLRPQQRLHWVGTGGDSRNANSGGGTRPQQRRRRRLPS